MKSQEPPPKRKFKSAKANTPSPDVDAAKALADYLRYTARLAEIIQKADGLDLARAKTPWPFKWTKMPVGALLTHMTTHDRRHLWQVEQVRNDPNFPHSLERVGPSQAGQSGAARQQCGKAAGGKKLSFSSAAQSTRKIRIRS